MKIFFVILEVQFYHERGLQLNSHVNCRIQMDVWIFTLVSSSVHLSKIVTAPSQLSTIVTTMAKHRYKNTEQAALLFQPRESSAPCSEQHHSTGASTRCYWRRGSKSTERPNSGTGAAASLCNHPTSRKIQF